VISAEVLSVLRALNLLRDLIAETRRENPQRWRR
jgi:hypothetical protein